ncbi:MAG: Sec-independent protein translocase subunit TatA, partial [Actinomadura sp.]
MPNLGAGEWLIILLVIVILFGSAKLPTLARSLGKSMRILKAETKGLHDDDDE